MAKAVFNWEDPFMLDQQLADDERMVMDSARKFASDALMPRVIADYREESFDKSIMEAMGEMGLLGITVDEKYGGGGMNHVCYGLAAREIERVDSGYRSAMSVQSSLVMYPIETFGTDDQKERFLPALASGKMIGCFGLTEPDYGSDAGALVTRAEKTDGGYKLTGSKMWISNAPVADIAVVWAKLDGVIRGFIVERDKAGSGFDTPMIKGKLSLRASMTGSIMMDGAFVPEENLMPEVSGLKGPFSASTRRVTASPGERWVPLSSAGMPHVSIRLTASSSAAPCCQPADPAETGQYADRDWHRPAVLPADRPHA